MLTVTKLSFSYSYRKRSRSGDGRVLKEVSFALPQGGCLVVMGANGCGKSTLLSLLSGALRPSSGTIETDGERIGLVPQGFSVFEDLSVLENVTFFARLAHRPVTRPLPFGLEPYAGTRACHLSGGYQKRLGIACTAAADPDIWLFDEPCANLDIVWRDEMIRTVCELKRAGRSILYVAHDPAEFLPFYDGILFLKDGVGQLVSRQEMTPGEEESRIRDLIQRGSAGADKR